jgi:outer membrane immunogenic protein
MKMYRIGFLAFTLSSVVALASANAADMYRAPEPVGAGGLKDDPYLPLWAGFYGGINGGYAWGDVKASDQACSTFVTVEAGGAANDGDESPNFSACNSKTARFHPNGGFGGGQIGYNIQRDRLVFGLEVDLGGMDLSGRKTVAVTRFNNQGNPVAGTLDLSSDGGFYGDFTGRLGYAYRDYLFYAKGGAAFLDSKFQFSSNGLQGSESNTLWGYTVGGGAEWMFRPNWSLKAEYLHFDFRSSTASASNKSACVSTDPGDDVCSESSNEKVKFNPTVDTVKVGINYHIQPGYEPLK